MGLETNKVTYKKSWELVRLKELCARISDGTHFTPEYINEGIPFISVKDIYDEKVHFQKCKYISKEAHQELIKRCYPEKDDVLITKSGTIGRMALVPDKPEFSLFVSVALLKNKKELIHSKFLKYCLENFLNHINIAQDIKGGLLKNFHLEDIRETLIPKVNLDEQAAIVDKIEELLSDLENGKKQLQTAQQQLKIYRQSLLKWAFEGKLIVQNEKWDFNAFKNCLKFSQGIQVDVKIQKEEKKENQVRFLRIIDFTQGKDAPRYIDNPGERYIVNKDEISLVRYGATTGFVCTGLEGAIANNLFKVTPYEKVLRRFLFYFLISPKFQNVIAQSIKGAAMPAISFGLINDVILPIPSLKEQQLIVDELDSKLTVCDKIEETITQSLQQSETLKQSILKKAFEGKLA